MGLTGAEAWIASFESIKVGGCVVRNQNVGRQLFAHAFDLVGCRSLARKTKSLAHNNKC